LEKRCLDDDDKRNVRSGVHHKQIEGGNGECGRATKIRLKVRGTPRSETGIRQGGRSQKGLLKGRGDTLDSGGEKSERPHSRLINSRLEEKKPVRGGRQKRLNGLKRSLIRGRIQV